MVRPSKHEWDQPDKRQLVHKQTSRSRMIDRKIKMGLLQVENLRQVFNLRQPRGHEVTRISRFSCRPAVRLRVFAYVNDPRKRGKGELPDCIHAVPWAEARKCNSPTDVGDRITASYPRRFAVLSALPFRQPYAWIRWWRQCCRRGRRNIPAAGNLRCRNSAETLHRRFCSE